MELEAQKQKGVKSSVEKEVVEQANSHTLEEAPKLTSLTEPTSIEVDLAPFLLQLGLENSDQRNVSLVIAPTETVLEENSLNIFDASAGRPTH